MLKARVCSACCTRLILKTSRKFLTRSPVNDFAQRSLKDRCRTSQHMNAVSAEMLRRVSVFQRTLDESRNSHRRCAVEGVSPSWL